VVPHAGHCAPLESGPEAKDKTGQKQGKNRQNRQKQAKSTKILKNCGNRGFSIDFARPQAAL
jgi:hypothetical protein